MTTPTLDGLPAGILPASPVTRIRVLTGEDDDHDRRGTKTVVARSDCRYYCPDAATAARCIEALRESDERLRSRPEELMLSCPGFLGGCDFWESWVSCQVGSSTLDHPGFVGGSASWRGWSHVKPPVSGRDA